MKFVVTGSSGFLGSSICCVLRARGLRVIGLDIAVDKTSRLDEFIQGTISDSLDLLYGLVDDQTVVIHAAAMAAIADCNASPFEALDRNVIQSLELLKVSCESNAYAFVFASSVYAMGSASGVYGATKTAVETLLTAIADRYDLRVVIARYGSLYGESAQDWNGLSQLIEGVLFDDKFCYEGSGKEKRNYIHVEDAAALTLDLILDGDGSGTYHIVGSQSYTSEQIISMIQEIAGSDEQVRFDTMSRNRSHYEYTPARISSTIHGGRPRCIFPSSEVDLSHCMKMIIEKKLDQSIDN